uniref:Uncharacterized protein n=1 Tax=Aegilops tauschii TaxID=37682 RepID=M8CQ14_AEGTA
MDETFCRTHGEHRRSKVVGDDEEDVAVLLARYWGGGFRREGIELPHASLGVDVASGHHGRNDLSGGGGVDADGRCQLYRRELRDLLVDEVDRELEVVGGGGVLDLVDAGDDVDLA